MTALAYTLKRRLPALLPIFLLGGVAVQAYLTSSFPATDDGKIHLYRLIELDHALRNGVVFPRWSPDLVFGYGFPLFNYYAPSPYYLGAVFHLVGFSYQFSILLTFATLIIVAGWAVYRLVNELFGARAGLVAAIAYVYAPYLSLNGLHRGALGEVAGMALMPLVLWRFVRLARRGTGVDVALAAGSLGLLLVTHNLTSLLFAPILLAMLAILWVSGDRSSGQMAILLGTMALGFALGAIFWLPAFAERNLVQISRLFVEETFFSLEELFRLPAANDPRLVLQSPTPVLGLPQMALALVAAGRLARGDFSRKQAALVGAALGGSLLLMALTLSFSAYIWDSVSLLRFVQFPWRLLGPASLLLAFLAGAAVSTNSDKRQRSGWLAERYLAVATSLTVVVIAIYGMWWSFATYEPPLAAQSIADIHTFEIEENKAGTTAFAEYLPGSATVPLETGLLATRYSEEGPIITRLRAEGWPNGARIVEQSAGLTRAQATVESPTAFAATWDWFMFDGWQARVDGERVDIAASEPLGLIQVEVPAGQHELEIRFGPTTVRLVAGLMSLTALLAIGVVGWRLSGREHQAQTAPRQSLLGLREVWPVAGVLVMLLVVKVGYLNRSETFFRQTRFDGSTVAGVSVPTRVLFEDALAFLGHDTASETIAAGEPLAVDLYWTTQDAVDKNYSTSAVLVDGQGHVVAQADSQHPGGLPTSRWSIDQYALDTHVLQINPDTAPGMYDLIITAYSIQGDGILPLVTLDGAGNPAGSRVLLGQIEVTRPAQPHKVEQIAMDEQVETSLSPAIELVGYSVARQRQAGDDLPIEIVWRATETVDEALLATLSLQDAGGNIVIASEVPLVAATYPTNMWRVGEVLRGRHTLALPVDLVGGVYNLGIALEGGETFSLGEVQLAQGIERVFEMPQVQEEIDQSWQSGIRLLGYDLMENEGQPLTLTLYWTTEAELANSYKVFVHVVDEKGEIVAQQDQIPAAWQRPTTGWAAQEVIRDEHVVALDEGLETGQYQLRVGLYDDVTLSRLLLVDSGAEFLELQRD